MAQATFTDEELQQAVKVRALHPSTVAAAAALGIPETSMRRRLTRAAERGMMGTKPVLPGFAIKTVSSRDGDAWVKQARAPGEEFAVPDGHHIKGVSALVDPDGREVMKWVKTSQDAANREAGLRAVLDALKAEVPRAEPVTLLPFRRQPDLLNFFALTDVHLGSLSWHEETGADYDLDIAERLIIDWFAAAIDMAPRAETAVLAQIGDALHYDSMESKTPASGHILDADSRFPKIVRAAIRIFRRVVRMLLEKHGRVHVIMADANHDPASGAWLREMFAAFYDDEPRVTVDSSASTYYVYEHGDVSLFVHHGHRRNIGNVDTVFAGKFREVYGRTRFSYAHLGHLHSDELKSTNLMKVERHETLAAPDAYAANGGWLSGRSAKVVTYHKKHGEVSRIILTPEMVEGAAA
ncbi:MAG: hypothetical protein FD152_3679 [Xanthobacteraceae bacterium]|nr:MAG: hypothetical protein FD152_3679 [Xanthobacteraceae bacterium]